MGYIALIGDIIGSRGLPKRQEVQEQFKRTCKTLNVCYKGKGLVSPVTITLGDEFQALFNTADIVWRCILAIEAAMEPVQLRFSLGVGGITTKVNTKAALEMDGPAFHLARAGIQRLKHNKGRYGVSGLERESTLVGCSLDLFSYHRTKWRSNRTAILAHLLSGRSVDEIQGRLGITEQAIYRNIREGGLEPVMCLLEEVARMCNETLEAKSDD